MTLAAGKRNALITIYEPKKVRDSLNQITEEYVPKMKVWAWVKGDTGMTAIRQSSTRDGVTRDINSYSFRINYRPTGIDTGMRIGYAGMMFDIQQVRHDLERKRWTDLVSEEGVHNG